MTLRGRMDASNRVRIKDIERAAVSNEAIEAIEL